MMAARKPITRTQRARRWFASEAGQKLNHTVPAFAVFIVAAYESYWHIVDVATRAGETAVTAHLMPASVDGMMMVAARYVTHAKTRLGKGMAIVAFVLGMFATLGANVMAADPNTISRLVAVWPAVALVGTAVVLHWGEMKPKRTSRAKRSVVTSPATLKVAA